MSTKATARVQVTVEVSLTQPWTAGFTIDQVRRSAAKEAVDQIKHHFPKCGFGIIGEPRVSVIMVEDT